MIYRHPDLDAAVSITHRLRRGVRLLQFDFLSRGRSQKRAAGKVVGYTSRNPDRLKLVEHVLRELAALYKRGRAVGSSGGKGPVFTPLDHLVGDATVRRTYSASGNYRWRLFVRLAGRTGLARDGLAEVVAPLLHLEPVKHKPVVTTWPLELRDPRGTTRDRSKP